MNSGTTPIEIWNSLEVAKLVASTLAPIAVVLVGLWINRRLQRLEHLQWSNQQVIRKRLAVYEELIPKLNDLLCYFNFIRCWKDLKPAEVVRMKLEIDKIAHVNQAFFSPDFIRAYTKFSELCYQTYFGWGK